MNTRVDPRREAKGVSTFYSGLGATLKAAGSRIVRKGAPLAVTVMKALSAVTVTTETTIWTPAAGRRFRLVAALLTVSASGNLTLRDNTAGTIIAIIPVVTGVNPVWFALPPKDSGGDVAGVASAAINNVLTATLSVAGTVTGTLFGQEEP